MIRRVMQVEIEQDEFGSDAGWVRIVNPLTGEEVFSEYFDAGLDAWLAM